MKINPSAFAVVLLAALLCCVAAGQKGKAPTWDVQSAIFEERVVTSATDPLSVSLLKDINRTDGEKFKADQEKLTLAGYEPFAASNTPIETLKAGTLILRSQVWFRKLR